MTPPIAVKILIVDDEPRNLVALEAALRGVDCQLVKAHSGREALKCLLADDFAAILLDIHMPDMDGFETARLVRMRDRSSLTPIIFLTADDRSGARVLEGYSLGAVDYLYKPFDAAILRSKVAVFVELFRKSVALEAALRQVSALNLEIATSEAKYRGLVERLPLITYIVTTEPLEHNRFVFVSPQIEADLGFSVGAWVSQPGMWYRQTHPDDRDMVRLSLRKHQHGLARGERQLDIEFRMLAADGHTVWYRGVAAAAARSAAGELQQQGFLVNISRRKASELERERLHAIVEREQQTRAAIMLHAVTQERALARTKDELLSVVSHELRTPLTSLVGFSELLLRREYDAEKRAHYLKIINQEGRRLTAIVTGFLDLQRMESGQKTVHLAATSVGAVIERAVTVAGEDPLRPIVVDLPQDLPNVAGDSDRLIQVFSNLLNNARKYSPDGGEISVSARCDGSVVRIEVADSGLGIPPDALPHLFGKFYRVDNSDRRAINGTGLGLAICRQIVAEHGGDIGVESPGLGAGARFWLTLRIAEPTPALGAVA